MRLVIDDFKTEHYGLLEEMAKKLNFKVSKVELSEDEEDNYLLSAMEAVQNEPIATAEEVEDFKNWLRHSK